MHRIEGLQLMLSTAWRLIEFFIFIFNVHSFAHNFSYHPFLITKLRLLRSIFSLPSCFGKLWSYTVSFSSLYYLQWLLQTEQMTPWPVIMASVPTFITLLETIALLYWYVIFDFVPFQHPSHHKYM
jgi:hypothetical protein